MSETISETALRQIVGEWIAQGRRVAGPKAIKPGKVLYAELRSPEQLLLSGFLRPANSIKEFFFPRHEPLYSYRVNGREIELSDIELPATPQVIVAARPCDAAALPILDPVFNWDYKDEFYNRRRQRTVVVSLACNSHDDHCFCTSVGLGPADPLGADALLFDLGDGSFEARFLSKAGRALFAESTTPSGKTATVPQAPEVKFDPKRIGAWAASSFENPLWQEQTLTCLGCGACAYTCPTCHCFDIADEGNSRGGARVKNWDSCQFPMFTAHASGHNPRSRQPQRQRQRIYHKFHMYPEKFGKILCTGCGNCTRNCPATLGVLTVLETVAEAANGKHL